MLHVILFLLKLIGWILLAILCLIVLLVLVCLCTPFRYRLQGDCEGDWKKLCADIRFSFLFHLVRGRFSYRDENLKWKLSVAWKQWSSETESAQEEESFSEAESAEPEQREIKQVEIKQIESEQDVEPEQTETKQAEPEEYKQAALEQAELKPFEIKQIESKQDVEPEQREIKQVEIKQTEQDIESEQTETQQAEPEQKESKQSETKQTESEQTEKKQSEKKHTKAKSEDRKEKYTFEKICDKINSLSEKKDAIVEFLTNEVHKAAVAKVFLEIKRLFGKLRWKHFRVNARFGFEDPSHTGLTLAALSMCYPLIDDYMQLELQPEFEQKILAGDLLLEGKIRLGSFLSAAWRILWNKNVRVTIRHIRNFKFH